MGNHISTRPKSTPGIIYLESSPPTRASTQSPSILDISGNAASSSSDGNESKKPNTGKDGRKRVTNSKSWPYSVQGILFMTSNEKKYQASGTLIGPRFVLTAAHNVFNTQNKQDFDKDTMIFCPAMSGLSCPYEKVKVVDWYYPEEFRNTGKEDYAVLVLESDIGYYTGMLGIKDHNRSDLNYKRCKIYGYPRNVHKQGIKYHYLWGMEGVVYIDENEEYLEYNIYTSPGQDGSAVWYKEYDRYYIIGVHLYGSSSTNKGLYLNIARLQNIINWMKPYYEEILDSLVEESSFEEILEQIYEARASMYVTVLDLNSNEFNIGPEGAIALSSANLINLTKLNLSKNLIQDQGVIALSQARLTHLSILDLSMNRIGDEGAIALSKSKFINLSSLNLSANNIQAEGAIALSSANFRYLGRLYLSHNSIKDEGAKALSKAYFGQLVILDLSVNKIGDEGAIALSIDNFINLMSLDLSSNYIGDSGANALSKATFKQLDKLDLSLNRIGEEGTAALEKAGFMNHTSLNVHMQRLLSILS
jgi:V8-like Glu-specific endopeptidase